jgi:hypothetical protein
MRVLSFTCGLMIVNPPVVAVGVHVPEYDMIPFVETAVMHTATPDVPVFR